MRQLFVKLRSRKPNGGAGELVGETTKETYSLPKGAYNKGYFKSFTLAICGPAF